MAPGQPRARIFARMSVALSLRTVCKAFGSAVAGCDSTPEPVLRDVSLDVHMGEVVGLVGARDAGKTTLLLCAAGIVRADSGAVRWFGVGDGGAPGPLPLPGIAFVPDHVAYYPFLTVREALEYYATLRDLPLDARAPRVILALRRVALDGSAARRISTLSPGALRRLALAQAILARPRLLLVDAARDPLDELAQAHVNVVLRELAYDGVAVLVAARDGASLRGLATRFIRLEAGRVAFPESSDLRATPPSPAPMHYPPRVRVAETRRR